MSHQDQPAPPPSLKNPESEIKSHMLMEAASELGGPHSTQSTSLPLTQRGHQETPAVYQRPGLAIQRPTGRDTAPLISDKWVCVLSLS